MTPLQIELTKLIGRKDLTFGCIVRDSFNDIRQIMDGFINGNWKYEDHKTFFDIIEIIGHPATLSDFHMWMNDNNFTWLQDEGSIKIYKAEKRDIVIRPYDSSKELLEQDEETLKKIVELIKGVSK